MSACRTRCVDKQRNQLQWEQEQKFLIHMENLLRWFYFPFLTEKVKPKEENKELAAQQGFFACLLRDTLIRDAGGEKGRKGHIFPIFLTIPYGR